MGWRENLLPASFRGVEFVVEERGVETGRRTQLHQYPQRDVPFSEDLGRRARRFTLSVFILGDDYMERRDALLEACEEPGPGELIDPWRGAVQVSCVSCQLREQFRDGAIARFSLSFEEAGENVSPTPIRATAPAVRNVIAPAIVSIREVFDVVFNVLARPSFLQVEAETLVVKTADELSVIERAINATGAQRCDFCRDLLVFRGSARTLIRTPATLSSDLTALVVSLATIEKDPRLRVDRMLDLADFGSDLAEPETGTLHRVQQAVNQRAIVSLTRRAAILEAGRATSFITYRSRNDAVAIRDRVLEEIDAELLRASEDEDDAAFLELRELYAAVTSDTAARGETLASIATHVPAATEPALVTAYRLHGDAGRDAELLARNGWPHPGFVPGGVPLEFLPDV